MLFSIATIAALTTAAFAKCNDYLLISTRGTGELQGPSAGFRTMISETLNQVPNGEEYDTKYPAGFDQNTSLGVIDIINKISDGLQSCPDQRYALLGYSQGATTTLDALNSSNLSEDAKNMIEAVILIGNPYRMPNQQSNVEGLGADNAFGVASALSKPIPDSFDESGKALDFCYSDDCICNVACTGFRSGHLKYGFDMEVQNQAAQHLIEHLS
ncbi:hypothetical protein E3P92_03298 [Wallemia ichthyophaga]|uniref:Acetylxylan esterase 2 n=1 Tax=Wallemia ichthyophaga TaxID=245174 RepID=A0A4T0IP17_WALIC|nr:hypothetical protein E3P92_03298 [Wallemia ichthyophaga]TIB29982.1 hypothetical protein E3P86_03581 [Wallemia ichthyophaga]